ncbi:MAG TPA: hypothetical protein VJN93_13200 [Candidatus Acidoferrum sp.]|nr:hypothetical protein [Candidatus Acidoferrum sp.]
MTRFHFALRHFAQKRCARSLELTFLWAFLALALHILPGPVPPAHAQGSRKDDIVFNSRGIPLAGASIRVCAMPASGQPCSPLALIYSDVGLTQALANPMTTDGLGNYAFYAAPGKYEIEISGPGITTKQLPNVILPNDPSSPTFSGAVSAFSLTLGGNLTVSGNTTVVGSLASGTLTLNNQGTPPGAAAAGTVNLYTKSADMRLYYKDQNGTEIGPLGPGNGAQLNVANTFTAPQNIAADFHTKGPNPFYDVTMFGGYEYTGTQPQTTGTMSASSTSLALASAQDFANGQGILVLGAGPATALATPAGLTVSQQNVVGSTSYTYCVVAEDYAGGRTACSAAASTSTGAANLGAFTVGTISSCTRASGIVTCTMTAPHNLSPNSFIELSGTGNLAYNGTATLLTASGSTFTFPQQGQLDDSIGVTTGTVKALALNVVQWNEVDYTVLRSYIYRCTTTCALPANASNFALAGVTQGMDGGFLDYGYAITASQIDDGDVPATAPTSATPQWLDTTIASGGGTTSLVLAAASTTAVSSAKVLHDNVPNIAAACSAMSATSGGGILYIPNTYSAGGAASFPINSTLNFATVCPAGGGDTSLEIRVASTIVANGSVIPRSLTKFNGATNFGHVGNFYSMEPLSDWTGNAYPFIYALPGTSHDWSMANFIFQAFRTYQADIVQDQDGGGNNVTSIKYSNVQLNANLSPSYILGGGFGFFWEYGGWSTGGSASFTNPPAMWNKANYGLGRSANSQLAGIFYARHVFVFGGQLYDAAGQSPLTSEGVGGYFTDMLAESSYGPMIRVRIGNNRFAGGLNSISYADFLGGTATPLVDVVNAQVAGLNVFQPLCANGNQAIFQAATSGYSSVTIEPVNSGCGMVGLPSYTEGAIFSNTTVSTSGASGQFIYAMPLPGAPASAVVSSGGGVPVGTIIYYAAAVDANGHLTPIGPGTSVNVTTGNQTVTVTPPTLPAGAIGWQPYRGNGTSQSLVNIPGCTYIAGNAPYVDTSGFTCGASSPNTNMAGSASMSSNGLVASQVKLVNNFVDTLGTATLTATRTQTFPDVTGIVPVSSYQNSAYDNAIRANGPIGSNWTVTQNGINISSNQFQGTATTSNSAYWNANSFSTSQFAQATISALNGTTDFPGVSVLNSGTGATSTFYDCIENTANIYIQRVVNAGAANITSAASTGAPGDILRLEIAPGGALTCYKNGAVALTFTDTQITTGSPGLVVSGNVATLKNWSGGNLHPLAHLDAEQDWTKPQHFTQGVIFGNETFTASPRGVQSTFLPGALTATWTGSTWTLDKAVTVTRVQVQAKTAPAGCTTSAVVRLSDGTSPVNVTISAAANDSGPITQNYAAAASLTVAVQTAAAGCTTSPADANVIVQYRMQ